jgi:hypothetical protein
VNIHRLLFPEILAFMLYKLLLESSWTAIIETASVKEAERAGQGHTSTSLFLSAMDDKAKQHVCIKICVKLSKSTIETLEMLREV